MRLAACTIACLSLTACVSTTNVNDASPTPTREEYALQEVRYEAAIVMNCAPEQLELTVEAYFKADPTLVFVGGCGVAVRYKRARHCMDVYIAPVPRCTGFKPWRLYLLDCDPGRLPTEPSDYSVRAATGSNAIEGPAKCQKMPDPRRRPQASETPKPPESTGIFPTP